MKICMKQESRTVSQAPFCRCKLQGFNGKRGNGKEGPWNYLNPFLALSLGQSETWSFQRLPPPSSLLLLCTGVQGPGQSCVRQVSPPCSTWGREGRWWVNPPLFSIMCWNVGDAGTFLPLCPKGRLLLCGHGWWQQDCLIPTGLLAWHELGRDVALDWSSLDSLCGAFFSGPLLPHCNQTDCWLKKLLIEGQNHSSLNGEVTWSHLTPFYKGRATKPPICSSENKIWRATPWRS